MVVLVGNYSDKPPSSFRARVHNAMRESRHNAGRKHMSEKLYKVTGKRQKKLEAPADATGYYRRDVSKDGTTITYRKVA